MVKDYNWGLVQENIHRSKIRRFPYKQLLGESLTNYILRCRDRGFSSDQTCNLIFFEQEIMQYMVTHPQYKEKLMENVRISVNARYSEESSRMR